jgi:hypothetical protein
MGARPASRTVTMQLSIVVSDEKSRLPEKSGGGVHPPPLQLLIANQLQ